MARSLSPRGLPGIPASSFFGSSGESSRDRLEAAERLARCYPLSEAMNSSVGMAGRVRV